MAKVGLMVLNDWRGADADNWRADLARAAAAGIDHIANADHVSFYVGFGIDGLVSAAGLLAAGDLPVYTALYLLPLRHPVLVARQVATLAETAPGRLTFGVGIGGEDRREIQMCGVDPATRGTRMDECLQVLRGLLSGEPVTFHGAFFDLDEALILPPPSPPVPIVVGGRSDAAVRRAARFGDGWLGIWASASRFDRVTDQINEIAADAGRGDVPWRHGLNVWCGVGDSREAARGHVAAAMELMYQTPFEAFEKWSPYGSPAEIAEFLAPYVDAGCTDFNLICQGPDAETIIGAVAETKKLLLASAS
jgi:alkanesulfonate monooxygenase SsuD/methylene tetrahydromethanopterin reductase-like flavin-dependent oxidoreductase (luciferase family)